MAAGKGPAADLGDEMTAQKIDTLDDLFDAMQDEVSRPETAPSWEPTEDGPMAISVVTLIAMC